MYRGLSPHKIVPMPGTHKCINADRFYTPRHFVLLCVKPSGYAERYTLRMKNVISIILFTTACPLWADTIDDVLFDTAIDFVFFEDKEVARTYSSFDYDRAICEDGEVSPYIDKRRPGCVNENTQIENYNDFREYNIKRNGFLLNNQK